MNTQLQRKIISSQQKDRRGAAGIFGIFLIAVMVILLGTVLDLSYVHVAQSELQRSSDASALAGGWALFDAKVDGASDASAESIVASVADQISVKNVVATEGPRVGAAGEVEIGYYDFTSGNFDTSGAFDSNAVRVNIHRQEYSNGEVPLFFGNVLGRFSQPMSASSTAALIHSISGFHTPPLEDQTLDLLPFALDQDTWAAVLSGSTGDSKSWVNGKVVNTGNGKCECNLYPQGTGSPGNRGTVDIGSKNNSTNDIARQIISGVSKSDLLQMGKPLEFDENGKLYLNGDTGISAGVKDELASIIGQRRIIPIFSSVSGNGNNATYTIVKFVGVRILEVKLTGRMSDKRVIVEPAPIIARNAKISVDATSHSDFVFAPVLLVN